MESSFDNLLPSQPSSSINSTKLNYLEFVNEDTQKQEDFIAQDFFCLEDEPPGEIQAASSFIYFFLSGVESEEVLGSLSLAPDYIYLDQTIDWQSNSYVTNDLDIFWSVGAGILKWYRVQGACAPCAFNNNCELTGLQVLGTKCIGGSTGEQFYIQNILATSVKEVCNILQESKLNWEVCSIKVYSRPADPSLSGPEDTCNTLIDVPFESIPECLNVYVQEKPFIKIKMSAFAITANFDVTADCEIATESNVVVATESLESIITDGSCFAILTGGAADVTGDTGATSSFEYISSGEPVLLIDSETEYESSWQDDPIIQIKMSTSITYFEAILSSQDKNSVLLGASSNVRTVCGNCTTMPSAFYLIHNLKDTLEIKNFLNKNLVDLPDSLIMRYNRKTNIWSANYQMSGLGSYGSEKWSFSFGWGCMNKNVEDFSSPYWKLSIFLNRLYQDINLDFDTKINIVFPPEYLCDQINGFNFNLAFSLNTVSEYVKNDYVNITEDVVLNDNIGLFKSDSWKSNPLLDMVLSNNSTLPLLENKDLTPIFPVA